jgi:2'-5' RNA ligase
MPSAVIVRARLPAGLERLRRGSVDDAADGVPAHLTLLYPFIEPGDLDPGVRRALAEVAARHAPLAYRLAGRAFWPDTVYVRVAPVAPFVRLQAELAGAFPTFPIYGRDAGFEFVPHVTIAEGPAVDDSATVADTAWDALPVPDRASAIEVIGQVGTGRWRTVWRIRLGGRTRSGRR